MVSTASKRAAAVQARSRAGLDSASLLQRSRVETPTPISRATDSTVALSGGSNRATALSLKSCPYRAKSFSHHRPRIQDSIEVASILTRGVAERVALVAGQARRLLRAPAAHALAEAA